MTPPAPVQFQPPVSATPQQRSKTNKAATVPPDESEINSNFVAESATHYRTFGWADLSQLVIDPTIQRPENIAEINKIAANFDEAALGTLTVSLRVNPDTGEETYVVIDGQQRRAGALKAGFTGKVRVDVHRNLTRADEARLFRLLNFRRAVAPIVLFKTALVEQDPHAMAVQKILDDLGIAFGTSRGFAGAKTALRLVARRNGGGETSLRWAFTQVQKIYDDAQTGGCYDANVIEAFYWLYERFGSQIDEANLYKKLARAGGGIDSLIGYAQTIRSVRKGRLAVNVIRAIISRYNQNKHSQSRAALPDWTINAATNAETDEVAEVGSEK